MVNTHFQRLDGSLPFQLYTLQRGPLACILNGHACTWTIHICLAIFDSDVVIFMIVSSVITLENIVISGCYAVHECCKILKNIL